MPETVEGPQTGRDSTNSVSVVGPGSSPQKVKKPVDCSINRMIEDTILKVTAQVPQPTSAMPPPTSTQFNNYPYPVQHQPNMSIAWSSSSVISRLPSNAAIPQTQPKIKHGPFPSSKKDVKYGVGNLENTLPQDILHILESDFTNVSISHYPPKEQEIRRIAEELKAKTCSSRPVNGKAEGLKYDDQSGTSDSESKHDRSSETSDSESEDSESDSDQEPDSSNEEDDGVDGSGDEAAEQARHIKALTKLKSEIEQMIGIPEEAAIPSLAPEDQSFTKTENKSLSGHEPQTPRENHSPSSCVKHDDILSAQETRTHSPKLAALCPVKHDKPSNPVREDPEELDDSGSESESSEVSDGLITRPTTAHELIEPPPEAIEVPFTRVSGHELKTISPFGSVSSLIRNVLVIQGTVGLGYDRVLDEGTLVCRQDGLVIGKIFETFGSVTNPHYSIQLSSRILGSSDEKVDLSPGLELYYLPNHSKFVFTSEIRAQPKGTDASNFFDEEVDHADEIEFSDDEAEAAYLRARKLAKKTSAVARSNTSRQIQGSRPEVNFMKPSKPTQISEKGRKMFVKRTADNLYNNNQNEDRIEAIESDYSLLERPKGQLLINKNHSNNSLSSPIDPTKTHTLPNQRSQGKRRNRGRDRNRKKGSLQDSNHSSNQRVDRASKRSDVDTHCRFSNLDFRSPTEFQSVRDHASEFVNPTTASLDSNQHSNQIQLLPGAQSMMMGPGNGNMAFIGMPSFNNNHPFLNSAPTCPSFWNPTFNEDLTSSHNNQHHHDHLMTMPMMMNSVQQTGIPCYNPLNPSTQQVIPSPSPSHFQFGFSSSNFNPFQSQQHQCEPINHSNDLLAINHELPHPHSHSNPSPHVFHFNPRNQSYTNQSNNTHFNPHFF